MKDKIIKAVETFMANDAKLLDNSAHEQAISHRIGVYLESFFESEQLNVDCEYNKHLNEPKKIDLYGLNPELCKKCGCDSCKFVVKGNLNEIPDRGFRPDILLHIRGTDDRNLIAIEVKKEKECPFDDVKLKALTKLRKDDGEYGYELGVFIWFAGNVPQYKWFASGQQL